MKARKRPVEVEAIQWTGDNWTLLTQFSSNLCKNGESVVVRTRKGFMRADLRDWIIKEPTGELYSVKPDVFEKDFET